MARMCAAATRRCAPLGIRESHRVPDVGVCQKEQPLEHGPAPRLLLVPLCIPPLPCAGGRTAHSAVQRWFPEVEHEGSSVPLGERFRKILLVPYALCLLVDLEALATHNQPETHWS